MALFNCLTTSVKSGQGTIRQPGCDEAEKGPSPSESCAADFETGTLIDIVATPYTMWEVDEWESSIDGVIVSTSPDQLSITILMPSQDVDITVSFVHPDINLTLQVGTGSGCVELITPSGSQYEVPCTGGTILVPYGTARIHGVLSSQYEVDGWTVDGVADSSDGTTTTGEYLDVPLEGYTSRTVVVNFTTQAACTENTLAVTVVGSGAVSPPSGDYCDYLTLSLNPVPSNGYFFKEWIYDTGTNITESGILLLVPMDTNRSITAVFEPLPDYVAPVTGIFYCPSETYKDSVISFDFTNDMNVDDPSNYPMFHFRVNFYADSAKRKLVYSSFSLVDNKRWFYNNNFFNQISTDGVFIESGQTMNIVYDPEILPSELTETQKEHIINNGGVFETPLVCGIQYYVDAEVYNTVTNDLRFLETISLILDCEDIDLYRWDYNKDNNHWLSSGQGKTDLQVTASSGQSIFSDISSNIFGVFQIIWQSRREDKNAVYSSEWDSREDLLYSSGQGIYDKLQINEANDPIVFEDQAANFYITGHTIDMIWFKGCSFPVSIEGTPTDTPTTPFSRLCYPGITTELGVSYDDIKVRVYEEDIYSSLVINKDKIVPVINQQSIRLDIDGVAGAYAVRLRNINDYTWGEWINIDSDLYYPIGEPKTAEDVAYNAYKIDNSRFIVPWEIDKINGLRRICCQILTPYGITRTYCLEIFVNFDVLQHVFEFYYDSGHTQEFPSYKGQYVLSLKEFSDNQTVLKEDQSTIYFKVIFSEPTLYDTGDIKFNVVQQGINDIRNDVGLEKIDSKTFKGNFVLYAEDGVFNKDGTGFIELILPDAAQTQSCLSDTSDPYNLMSDKELSQNKDLTPEEVYQRYQKSKVFKILDINEFKQYYDKDDTNFKFGNPLYFKDL